MRSVGFTGYGLNSKSRDKGREKRAGNRLLTFFFFKKDNNRCAQIQNNIYSFLYFIKLECVTSGSENVFNSTIIFLKYPAVYKYIYML